MLPPISGVVSRFSPSSVAASVRTTALSSSDELPNAGRRVAGRKAGVGARSGILPFGPRSSVDRATDFESVWGGSFPPGAARLLGRRLLSAGRDRPTEPPDAAGCTPLAARRWLHAALRGRAEALSPPAAHNQRRPSKRERFSLYSVFGQRAKRSSPLNPSNE